MVEAEEKIATQLTEVGVIPEDWTVKPLKCVADFGSGTTPSRSLSERYFVNGTVHWVKTMDLNNGHLYDTSEKVTDVALREVSSLKVYPPDTVLVAMYGGFNQIGRTGFLKINAAVNQALVAVQVHKNKLDPDYLIHYLNYRVDYWKEVASSSRKDPNITSSDVKLFPIALPPTKDEQTVIASVINDIDKLITGLKRLITKKKEIRKGLLQKLLTAEADWKQNPIGQISNSFAGGTPSTLKKEYWGGDIIWLQSGRCQNNVLRLTKEEITLSTKGLAESAAKLIKKHSVLIAITGATCGNIAYLPFEAAANQSVVAIEPFDELESKYLYYFLLTKRSDILSLQTGSAQGGTNLKSIKSILVSYPGFDEQQRISRILTEADEEIAVMHDKLSKYTMLKVGLMQNLFTGKIRLL